MKFIVFILFLLGYQSLYACTTILIGKKLTKSGSVILAHNEDMGRETAGILKYYKGTAFPSQSMIQVPYVELKQDFKTYSFWGAGNARNVLGLGLSAELPYSYNHILVGMNENGLALASNWMNSKSENLKGVGIRRYAIRQLVLERAKTARQAVKIITELIERYGQADWGGLTYAVADSQEAWIVETTTRHWVARRIRDDEIWTVANRFTITDNYDLASEDLINYAYSKKWIPTKQNKLNFRATFGKFPENAQDYDISREDLVQRKLSKYKGKIDLQVLMTLLKYRYQDEINFKPITAECWRDYCEKKIVKRPLSSCLTQSSVVADLHSRYNRVGGKMWYLHGSPHAGVYFPIYGKLGNIQSGFGNDAGQDSNSYWWKFRLLQQKVDENYDSLHIDFNRLQTDVQTKILVQNSNFELSEPQNLAVWALHQEQLAKIVLEILSEF